MPSSKTYLITGGAGFIGSHLAEALLSSGNHVIVIDDLSTGRLENIAGFRVTHIFTLPVRPSRTRLCSIG